MKQTLKDVLVMRRYQGWLRALQWAARTIWADLRWGTAS